MTAPTVQSWLEDMTTLYGIPDHPKQVKNQRTVTDAWRWETCSVTLLRWVSEDPLERSFHLKLWNGRRDVEVRDTGQPTEADMRFALELARLLPCPDCRGLKERLAGRDETGERWTRCGCTDPSPRPRTGTAVPA